jgi:hypothetical protein
MNRETLFIICLPLLVGLMYGFIYVILRLLFRRKKNERC